MSFNFAANKSNLTYQRFTRSDKRKLQEQNTDYTTQKTWDQTSDERGHNPEDGWKSTKHFLR